MIKLIRYLTLSINGILTIKSIVPYMIWLCITGKDFKVEITVEGEDY